MHKQGKVVRWEADKGFGFIRGPDTVADAFFHVRDFRGPGVPIVGMPVTYEEIHVGGKGPRAVAVEAVGAAGSSKGRASVRRPIDKRRSSGRDVWLRPVLFLALAYGGVMLWAAFYGLLPMSAVLLWPLLNVVTFWFYWRDKYAAQKRTWRTPENTLHALSLLGGWPAARVAQQWMRHKTVKSSFQGTYWVTVVLNVGGLVAYLYQAVSGGDLSR
jgi:uncharacterized membrane protein YsdA (DUF1294 family)/cold shock CspA family protein